MHGHWKKEEWVLGLIFTIGKLVYFFRCLCDYSDKFPKIFRSSCGMEYPSTANFCHQCGQQLNWVRSRIRRQVRLTRKTVKGVFPSGISLAVILSLLEKRHGVRMHVRMLKRKLKHRPRKLTQVRRCFLSTFTLITCRSFIILNFIYARKASQIQVRKLCQI